MTDEAGKWSGKLSANLYRVCGSDVRDTVMDGVDEQDDPDDSESVLNWTVKAVNRMRGLLTPGQLCDVMCGCACRYPTAKLEKARKAYLLHGEIDDAVAELRSQLEDSLRNGMLIEPDIVDWLLSNGWGVAGKRNGDAITVVKIPKSGNLRKYMASSEPGLQRELYCHCPVVGEAVSLGIHVPKEYCLCGAGFYRHIWETILEAPVEVEVIETVCSGGNVCSFLILLPGTSG